MASRDANAPVLVTGGASGLGAAIVEALRKAGRTALVLDQRELDDALALRVDLADSRAAEAAVRTALERHGGLSGVVTAAGTDACGPLADAPAERWERVIRVNLLGTAAVIRAALPALERARGRIVTVASTLGLRALPDATAYCASKFGVVGFTRALQAELKGRVAITMLTPGGMHTAFFDEREEQYRPGADAQLCQPRDVADAVVFALTRPAGCEVKEMVVTPPTETSWP